MERPILLPAVLVMLAVVACSPQAPEADRDLQAQGAGDSAGQVASPTPGSADGMQAADPAMDPCDPTAVQSLVGEQATDDVIERARIDAGAEIVRTLRPDQDVTMEYLAGRLNIDVDDAGTITGLRCG